MAVSAIGAVGLLDLDAPHLAYDLLQYFRSPSLHLVLHLHFLTDLASSSNAVGKNLGRFSALALTFSPAPTVNVKCRTNLDAIFHGCCRHCRQSVLLMMELQGILIALLLLMVTPAYGKLCLG